MTRITVKHLQPVVDRINSMTGAPATPYSKDETTGRHVPNVGNYHLSGAYGGWCLHQMTGEGGGVSDVFRCGHIPARELYERMHTFIEGLRTRAPLN